jgi:spore coat protein U-like protein
MPVACKFPWRAGLMVVFALLALACAFLSTPARANVVCTPGTDVLNFGSSLTAAGTLSYTCTNFNTTPTTFTLCNGIGDPSYPGTAAQPKMLSQASNATLDFNVYIDAAEVTLWTQTNPLAKSLTIPPNGASVSGSFTFYGRIAAGQRVPTDTYTAYFFNTVLGFIQSGNPVCQRSLPNFAGQDFNLTINATRADACELGVSSAVDFGTVGGQTGDVDAVGSVRLQCPIGRGWTLSFDGGHYAVGADRRMHTASGDYVTYRLYRDTARQNPIAINDTIVGTGTGAVQTSPIYGRATLDHLPPVGTYSDTVIIVVKF